MKQFWNLPVYVGFSGGIDADSGKKFVENMEAAENAAIKAGQKILPITINSSGGCVYAARGMIDAIQKCSLTVATVAESKAMSAAAWLFSCGAEGHRYVSPSATLMIHTVSTSHKGKIDAVKVNTKEAERLNKLMFKSMSVNCGHHDDYFKDLLKNDHTNSEWFLDAQDALKHNLANKIGAPSMTINVKLDFNLE